MKIKVVNAEVVIFAVLCVINTCYGFSNLYSDTWVATDALGRKLPTVQECPSVREDRYVAIFYWTWHTLNGSQGPFDITKILSKNPQNPGWGPYFSSHHWGEPELGYYISTDPYVIRKHASMLTDAGVDVIIFDTTNPPLTFYKSYIALCEVYSEMRREGNDTPQIAFLCPFSKPDVTLKKLYNEFYSKNLYSELWFKWQGKPLVLADPNQVEAHQIKQFFTFRAPIGVYFTGPTAPDQWGWLEVYPQHGFYNSKGEIEEVTVGVAQNALSGKLAPMSHKSGVMGRSWHNGHKDRCPYASDYGFNFQEQWNRAFELDPKVIFITGWNEWVALRFEKWYIYNAKTDSYHPDALFVDQYSKEYSRDIEPMRGGHTDNYYYQTQE